MSQAQDERKERMWEEVHKSAFEKDMALLRRSKSGKMDLAGSSEAKRLRYETGAPFVRLRDLFPY